MVFYTPGCFVSLLVFYLVFLIVERMGLRGFGAWAISFFVSLMVLSWIGKIRRAQAMREEKAREKERQRRMEDLGATGPDDLMARAWVTGNRPLAISLGTARLHAYVAASDGHFSQEEFQRILGFLQRWNAHPMLLQLVAMDLMWFSQRMNIESVCKVLKEGVGTQSELLTIFQSAVSLAAFDGEVDSNERRALNLIAELLGITPDQVEESIRLETGSRYYRKYAHTQDQGRYRRGRVRMDEVPISQHYKTLGLSPTATADEVKKAYRELARKYHPDMVSGMSEEFKKMAEEKFKSIQAAYEALRKARA